jgi:mannan endo-1,4-beta-mannosidase
VNDYSPRMGRHRRAEQSHSSRVRQYLPRLAEIRDRLPTLADVRDRVPTMDDIRDRVPTMDDIRDRVPTIDDVRDRVSTLAELRERMPSRQRSPRQGGFRDRAPVRDDFGQHPPTPAEFRQRPPTLAEPGHLPPTPTEFGQHASTSAGSDEHANTSAEFSQRASAPDGFGQQPPSPAAFRRRHHGAARRRVGLRRTLAVAALVVAGVVIAAVIVVTTGPHGSSPPGRSAAPAPARPRAPGMYLGVFTPRSPQSYAGVAAFSADTGVKPGLVAYYSGWGEPFQTTFAATAVRHHAMPLVQIDPTNISLSAIAAGQYDGYLRSYASSVRSFGAHVVISFGHEMNGRWYSWGYTRTSPAVFVAAWRHIVKVFRQQGATNVTWLWTVNIVDKSGRIPNPARWWPGGAYVNWVGIDGYYYQPSWTFASLFGPTIKLIRRLTLDPILIAETAVAPAAGKVAKIADLFAGIRAYGLLGFVWFDASRQRDWRLSSPAAFAAFGHAAKADHGAAL